MAPTAFCAPASVDADAGTANNDSIPTTITVSTAANATNTRPAAGRTSEGRVRLEAVITTTDSLPAGADRHAALEGSGWRLREEPSGLPASTAAHGMNLAVTPGRFLQPSPPVRTFCEGNPRTRPKGGPQGRQDNRAKRGRQPRAGSQAGRDGSGGWWAQAVEEAAQGGQLAQVLGPAGGFFGGDHVGQVGDGHAGMVTDDQTDSPGGHVGVAGGAFGGEADIERSVIGEKGDHRSGSEGFDVEGGGDTFGHALDAQTGTELFERGGQTGQVVDIRGGGDVGVGGARQVRSPHRGGHPSDHHVGDTVAVQY